MVMMLTIIMKILNQYCVLVDFVQHTRLRMVESDWSLEKVCGGKFFIFNADIYSVFPIIHSISIAVYPM